MCTPLTPGLYPPWTGPVSWSLSRPRLSVQTVEVGFEKGSGRLPAVTLGPLPGSL